MFTCFRVEKCGVKTLCAAPSPTTWPAGGARAPELPECAKDRCVCFVASLTPSVVCSSRLLAFFCSYILISQMPDGPQCMPAVEVQELTAGLWVGASQRADGSGPTGRVLAGGLGRLCFAGSAWSAHSGAPSLECAPLLHWPPGRRWGGCDFDPVFRLPAPSVCSTCHCYVPCEAYFRGKIGNTLQICE